MNKGMEGVITGLIFHWQVGYLVTLSAYLTVHQSAIHPVKLATNRTLSPLQRLLSGGESEIEVRRHMEHNEKSSLSPCTGFVPFFRNKFPGLFQDSD